MTAVKFVWESPFSTMYFVQAGMRDGTQGANKISQHKKSRKMIEEIMRGSWCGRIALDLALQVPLV